MCKNGRWTQRAIGVCGLALALLSAPPGLQLARASAPPPHASVLDPVLEEAIRTAPAQKSWPNSSYVKLLDLGTVTVRADGTTIGKYRETFKLFNQNARNMAEVQLPYNASYQDMRVISARTIQTDGRILDVKPDDIRRGGLAGDYLMYDDAMAITFSMPGVQDGCIIDYTYELVTHPNLMSGQFSTYWGFNDSEPVLLSSYVLHVPSSRDIRYRAYNDPALKPTVATSLDGRQRTYHWQLKDMGPIDLEPSMPPVAEVRKWLEVSSISSWNDIAAWFRRLQAPQEKPDEAIRQKVSELIAGKTTDDEKAAAIYDWVAQKTRYVGLEFGISAYQPHSASDVFHNLYGDCKDKANLLISMLSLAGISASPVLLHADDRRPIESDLPTLTAFNHCIALATVSGRPVWLDATSDCTAYGDIPQPDRGVDAFVVAPAGGSFEVIPGYAANQNGLDISADFRLQPNGAAQISATATMVGETGQIMREQIRTVEPDKQKEVAQKLATTLGVPGDVRAFAMPDGMDNTGPYVLKLTTTLPQAGKTVGHLLLVPLLSSLGTRARGNRADPYVADARVWPVVAESSSHLRCVTTFHLPAGSAVADLPSPVQLSNPLQRYSRTVTASKDGRTVTVVESFVENAGTAPASDYATIRKFWSGLLNVADDEIALRMGG